MTAKPGLEGLLAEIRACRICRDTPRRQPPLAHEPRPVIQASSKARICIAGQAPGTRADASGRPFTDQSGVRLRQWLGITDGQFYDADKVAVVGMGFCFPGNDAKGGDLPPRHECAPAWRDKVFHAMPQIELLLLVGQYAQKWHLPPSLVAGGLTATMLRWREIYQTQTRPRLLALPHPSWRNSGWLKRNPWFETDLLPVLRADVARLLA